MLVDELKQLDPAEEIPDSYFDQMLEERLYRTSTCPGGGSSVDWVARACNAYERVRTANQKGLAAEEKHAAFASKMESDNGNDNDISSDSSTDFGSLDSNEELDVAGVMAARTIENPDLGHRLRVPGFGCFATSTTQHWVETT